MNYANPNTNIDINGGQITGLAPGVNQTRQLQFAGRVNF